MGIWEAYSRNLVTVTQVDVTIDFGGGPITATLGYEVASTASVGIAIDEFVVLLSPNPRELSSGATTQDGVLLHGNVDAGGTLTYMYGDYVAQGYLPEPAWWCTEAMQYVNPDISIGLGGEILPFELEALVQTREPGFGGTQDQLWEHLRTSPTVVVGKTVDDEFWEEIPEFEGEVLTVDLRATNLAIKDTTDGLPDADAPAARVWDVIPAGFTLDEASVQPSGYTTAPLPDGATRISWNADLPAADVTGMDPGGVPTPYVTRSFSYQMTTPHLTPGRLGLPRARVSDGADFIAEAHSAIPLLDVLRVPMPPVVDAGGPYETTEGGTITFVAIGSDPNLDPLVYRWDFTGDGTWDTPWSSDPTATKSFGDDVSGIARVEVSDGEFATTAEAGVGVSNLAPSVTVSVSLLPCQDDPDEEGGDDDDEEDDEDDDDEEEDDEDDDEGDSCERQRGFTFVLVALVTDIGSDDLTLIWSGNCAGFVSPVTHPNDPAVFPDPFPSPDMHPRVVADTQTVGCRSDGRDDDDDDEDDDDDDDEEEDGDEEGTTTFLWTLEVVDDDGGAVVVSGSFPLPTRCNDDEDDEDERDDDEDDEREDDGDDDRDEGDRDDGDDDGDEGDGDGGGDDDDGEGG